MKQTSGPLNSPQVPTGSKSFRHRWKSVFRATVGFLVLIALAWTLRKGYLDLRNQPIELVQIQWSRLVFALAAYLGTMMLSWFFWYRVLLALGQHPSKLRSLKAFFVSQLGKYVPGKAMVVVLRTDLVRDENVKTAPAAASVFIETLTWIFVGSVIASLLLVIQFNEFRSLQIVAVIMALVAGALTWPPFFNRIASRIKSAKTSGVTYAVDFSTMIAGWLLLTAGWCLNGLSLFLVIDSLPGTEMQVDHFPLALAAVTLATVGGFVSLLPGGLGVRELVMIPLLGSVFGTVIALIAVILLRFVWLTAEFVSSGILYLIVQLTHESELRRTTSDDG